MNRNNNSLIVLCIFLVLVLAACTGNGDGGELPVDKLQSEKAETIREESQVEDPDAEPYPAGSESDQDTTGTYPPSVQAEPNSGAYPPPADGNEVEGTRFEIDLPVYAGESEISGTGKAGTPLELIDITFGGILGSTVVDSNERFAIKLASELEPDRLIGIRMSVPRESEEWAELWEMRSKNARSVPNVGYFLDTVVVREP